LEKKQEMTTRAVMAMAMQVGFSTALSATLCIGGGVWLDRKYGTAPLFILIGAALGLVLSLYLVWQIVKPLQNIK